MTVGLWDCGGWVSRYGDVARRAEVPFVSLCPRRRWQYVAPTENWLRWVDRRYCQYPEWSAEAEEAMNALTLNYDPTLREQQTAGRRCRSTGTPGTEAIQRNEHLMNCHGPDIHKLSSGLASVSAVSEKLCRTRLWTRSSINQTEITQLLYTRHQTRHGATTNTVACM